MNKIMNTMLKNNFIIPNYNNLNIVDLMRAIYCKYNIKTEINKNVETFKKLIPNNKHLLFILSDGTGSNLINKLNDDSILKRNKKDDIITVFSKYNSMCAYFISYSRISGSSWYLGMV